MKDPEVDFLRKRFQPKGSMCMNCLDRNSDCSKLDFNEMPCASDYVDASGLNPFHVITVICKQFKPNQ